MGCFFNSVGVLSGYRGGKPERFLMRECCPKTEEENLRECVGDGVLFGDRGGKPERVCW